MIDYTVQVWSKTLSTTPVQELQQYASAMGVIAGRLWVQQGYDWTAKHCVSELRGTGAQRSLRRAARKWYYDTTGKSKFAYDSLSLTLCTKVVANLSEFLLLPLQALLSSSTLFASTYALLQNGICSITASHCNSTVAVRHAA
jgi:hypothetical protein